MKRLEPKHPLAVRWFHWINFPLLAAMIWSGTLIYWANAVYRVGVGKQTLLKMNLPPATWKRLGADFRLADGMALHFFFMWFFAINGIAYVLYTALSGEWRYLVPSRGSLRDAIRVTLHDAGLLRFFPKLAAEPRPESKFNGAQQFAYTAVVLMGFGSLLTGMSIYKPVQFSWLTGLFGGYQRARFFHFWLTVGYVLFFVVHILQVIRAGWNNFRAMVIGVEVRDVTPPSPPDLIATPEIAPAAAGSES